MPITPPTQPTADLPDSENHVALLRHYLRDTDESCPSCNYALRGLTTDRCPECNQQITLRIKLVEPRLAAFIATMIALASGFGFSSLLLLYFVIAMLRRNGGLPDIAFPVIVGTGTLFNAALLWWLLRKRGAFCRASAVTRWSLFAAATLATITLLLVFTFNIR
jgi:hypothetical protein